MKGNEKDRGAKKGGGGRRSSCVATMSSPLSLPLPLQVTPCLFINKVDRLVLELGLTPSEAEQRLAAIVTHANMVVR